MKKHFVALTAILVVALSTSAYAAYLRVASPRGIYANVDLGFSGDIATCSISIPADSTSDTVNAVIKLWNGGTCLRTWLAASTGPFNFCEIYPITKGKTYKLEVNFTINGTSFPSFASIGTCPR